MTKIKLCGLRFPSDVEAANQWKPEYVGFVFAQNSRRYVAPEAAAELRRLLSPDICAGTGRVFDWQLVRTVRRPFLLAGGLNALNVETAVRGCRPFAVDVSSGIETDGKKDQQKIAAFVAAVRRG